MKFLPIAARCGNCGESFDASFLETVPLRPLPLAFTCPACRCPNRMSTFLSLLVLIVIVLPCAFLATTLVTSGLVHRSDWFAALLIAAFALYSRLVFMLYFKLRTHPFR